MLRRRERRGAQVARRCAGMVGGTRGRARRRRVGTTSSCRRLVRHTGQAHPRRVRSGPKQSGSPVEIAAQRQKREFETRRRSAAELQSRSNVRAPEDRLVRSDTGDGASLEYADRRQASPRHAAWRLKGRRSCAATGVDARPQIVAAPRPQPTGCRPLGAVIIRCDERADAVHHPLFARFYTHVLARNEPAELRAYRDELLAGLSGRVVEVGAGSGANFPHYPRDGDRGRRRRAGVVPARAGGRGRRERARAGDGARRRRRRAAARGRLVRRRRRLPRAVLGARPGERARRAAARAEARRRAALLRARARARRRGWRAGSARRPHLLAARLRRLPHRARHRRRDRGGRLRARAPPRPAARVAPVASCRSTRRRSASRGAPERAYAASRTSRTPRPGTIVTPVARIGSGRRTASRTGLCASTRRIVAISNCAKLAPMQRRTPPPNGSQP